MQKEKWWKEVWSDWDAQPCFYLAVALMVGAVISGFIGYYSVKKLGVISIALSLSAVFSWIAHKAPKAVRGICIVLLLIALFICVILIIDLAGAYQVQSSGDAASWVQAIGSIGAIGVAIYITSYEQRQRRNEKREDLRGSIRSLINSINFIQVITVSFYNLIVREIQNNDKTNFDDLFNSWSKTFTEVYLHQQRWIDTGLITSVMEVSLQLKKMLEINQYVLSGKLDNMTVSKEMEHVFCFLVHSKSKIVNFAIDEGLLKKGDKLIQDIECLTELKAHLDEAQLEKMRQDAQKALEGGSLSGNAG